MNTGYILNFIIIYLIGLVDSQTCGNTESVGENNPSSVNDDLDAETGTSIILIQGEFSYSCCGYVNRWEFYADSSYSSGSFYAQVWRPVSGNTYMLVGSNELTPNNPGNNEDITIPVGQRIMVQSGDYIGLHSIGQFFIPHETRSGGFWSNSDRLKMTSVTTPYTTSASYDWSSAGNEEEDYAINSFVTPSQTPSFSGLSAVSFVNDEITVGMVMASFAVSDADTEESDSLTVTMQSSTNGGTTYFELPAGTLNVTMKAIPPVQQYDITLQVQDLCGNTNTDIQTIVITNRVPVINNLPNTTSISEDTPGSTSLYAIDVTDTITSPVPCSMQAGDTSLFEVADIGGSTYAVKTKAGATFNYDVQSSHSVTVRCDDGDDTIDGILTINLIRNEPPTIDNLANSTSFIEDLNTRTLLYTLVVSDPTGDSITCVLNPTSSVFDVSQIPSTSDYGIYLTGGTTLDYDTISTYSLIVECSDARRSTTGIFTVNLIRNTPPVIENLPGLSNISEDASSRTLLYILNVTDVNTADVINCTLNTFTSIFEVATVLTGEWGVYLQSGASLDYDTVQSYVLSISCADHRRDDTGSLIIDVIRNEPPTITNLPNSRYIPEGTQSETYVYTVTATDPTNDPVTCSILTTTSMFYMVASTNQNEYDIYCRSSPNFNYTATRSYLLSISCSDIRRNVTSKFYTYVSRNKAPIFTNLQGKTSLFANLAGPGDVIYTVTAQDNENDQLQFSMNQPANGPFSININTGEISLTRSIKAEDVTGYDLSIYVSDWKDNVGPSILTVLISGINFPPLFRNLPLTLFVQEHTATSSVVFEPIAYDKDTTDSLSFSASFDPPNCAVFFETNATDGKVSVKNNIDYETIETKTCVLVLYVTDSFSENNRTLTINILNVNEAPVFTKKSYTFTATEGNAGTVLQNPFYQYNDDDGDTVSFSFDCGSDTGRLDMNPSNGFFSYAINYDLDSTGMSRDMFCKIYISDGEYQDTAELNITGLDSNDNSPVFEHITYTFFVPKTTVAGSIIGQTNASDADIGAYGNIHYHIDQGNILANVISVSSSGTLTLIQSLESYTEGSEIEFIVYAVDTGGKQDYTTVKIIIPGTSYTTTTVDDTIKYITFFKSAKNMAWFVPAMFVVFITLIVVVHTCYKLCFKK